MSILLLIIGFFIAGGTCGAFLISVLIGGSQLGERQDYMAGFSDGYQQAKKELEQIENNNFITSKERGSTPEDKDRIKDEYKEGAREKDILTVAVPRVTVSSLDGVFKEGEFYPCRIDTQDGLCYIKSEEGVEHTFDFNDMMNLFHCEYDINNIYKNY